MLQPHQVTALVILVCRLHQKELEPIQKLLSYWKLIIHPVTLLAASNTNTTHTSWILGTVQLSLQIWITSRVRPSLNCIHIYDFLFCDFSQCLYISKILQKRFSRLYWKNIFFQYFSKPHISTHDYKHSTSRLHTTHEAHSLTLATEVNGMTHVLEVSCTFTYLTHYPSTQSIENLVSAAAGRSR